MFRIIEHLMYLIDINKKQSSWKAVMYKEYQNMTMQDMMMRSGGQLWTAGEPNVMSSSAQTFRSNCKLYIRKETTCTMISLKLKLFFTQW